MEQAKNEIYNLVLNSISKQYGIHAVIKHISNTHNVPYDTLKQWADEQRTEILKTIENTIYHKVEIHIDEIPATIRKEQTSYAIAIDNTISLPRRLDSVALIKERDMLIKLYKNTDSNIIKKEIIKSSNLHEINDLALKEKDEELRIEAIKSVHNQLKLRWVAEENSNKNVRIQAIKKLNDPHALQKIIIQDKDLDIRKTALQQIDSISLLEATKKQIDSDFKLHINNRISALKGTDDHLKNSIEDLIKKHDPKEKTPKRKIVS